jgi:protoheme IX farnesyltransferase
MSLQTPVMPAQAGIHDFNLQRADLGATASDWLALLKPRVLTLVVFTGAIGLIIAPVKMNPVLALTAILCITLAAGAAGAINMWYDRDIDAVMKRTATRPIPAGRIAPDAALAYGVFLSLFSVVLMALATNFVAAAVLAISIGFYVFIYTMWLKRRTPQNIVIGGAAGAFPAVIGWAAATGSISLLPVLLFIIAFLWTPPHFWSLALYASGDYERAGVPMLPVVRGARHTRWNVLVYTLLLVASTLLPWALGYMGWIYGVTALGLGAVFIYYAWAVLTDAQDETGKSLTKDAPAKAAFKYSILYMFILFGACAVDRLI